MSWGTALARRLMADGIVEPASVIDGAVLRDVSRRNQNALVSDRDTHIFVKRAVGSVGATEAEAGWYTRLAATPVGPYLPRLIREDRERRFLVFDAPSGAVDLWAHHVAAGGYPVPLAHELGRALGLLHGLSRRPTEVAPDLAPFALYLHRPRVDELSEMTPATVALRGMIQGQPSLGMALDRLRAGWPAECTIHYDLKWANVLSTGTADGRAIRLVDWEHAGDGDPAWDLGSALAGYLTFWMYSIRAPAQTPAADLVSAARFPLTEARPAMDACWRAYRAAAGVPAGDAAALATRTAELCAARLLLTAYEIAQTADVLDVAAALHVQVAANILDDPAVAARRLLGLSLHPLASAP